MKHSICLIYIERANNQLTFQLTVRLTCVTTAVHAYRLIMEPKISANVPLVSPELNVNMVHLDPYVNECVVDNGGCHHDCVNTIGTFYCRCWSGFELEANGKNCKDIDECATSNGGCSHRCVNSPGGHRCECPPGMQVNSGGRICVGKFQKFIEGI
ncbi:EGF-like domain protein [Dictyocaulus viviparus]|uniref:EGF-like domain protein n=1 Tax=Dictyocaulus viviparus TaxID=29172 RepID=A0A0D8XKN6_DICVI|nr:EGF-like domain protein [Dictyocaulus viviparus]